MNFSFEKWACGIAPTLVGCRGQRAIRHRTIALNPLIMLSHNRIDTRSDQVTEMKKSSQTDKRLTLTYQRRVTQNSVKMS